MNLKVEDLEREVGQKRQATAVPGEGIDDSLNSSQISYSIDP